MPHVIPDAVVTDDSTLSVLAGPTALPGFWKFMYYVSPFTYLVDGMLSVGLANTDIVCSSIEFTHFNPRPSQTCYQYMFDYSSALGGYLTNPNATENCEFCPVSDTNLFLRSLNSDYHHRWRNFGIMWGYIMFNVAAALGLYWLARVPKKQKVLDSPPTELASRVQTRASRAEQESRRDEKERAQVANNLEAEKGGL